MPLITTAKPRSNITGLTTVAASHRVTSSNFFNDNSDSPIKNGLTACAGVLFIILIVAVSLLLYCLFKRSTLRKAQKAAALNRRQARESGGAVTGRGAPSKPLSDVFVVDITKKPARKPSIPDPESAANYNDATVGDKKRLVEGEDSEGHRKYNSRLKGHQGHSSSEHSGDREVRAVSSSTPPPPYPHDEISHGQGHASTSQSHRSARSRPSSAAAGEGQGEGRSGSAASLRVHNEKLPPPAPSSEFRKDKRESSTGAKKRRQNFRKMSEESLIGTSTTEDDEEVVLYSTTGSSSSPKHARDVTSSKTESSTIQRISEEYQTTATDDMSVTSTRHHSEIGSQGEDRTYAEIADTSPSNISSEETGVKQPQHQQRPASAGTAKPPLPPDGARTHHHGHQSRSRSESVDGGRVIASKPGPQGDATYAQVSALSTERVPKKKSYPGAEDGTGNGAGAEEADDEISEAASEDKDQPDSEADKQDKDAGRRKRPPVDKRRRAASADAKKKVAFESASSTEQPLQQQPHQPLQQAVVTTTVAVAEGSQGQGNEPPLFFKPRVSLAADGGLGEGDLRELQQKLALSVRHQRRHSVDHAVTLTDERSDVDGDGGLASTLPSALPEVVIPTARLAVSVPTTPTKQLHHGHGEVTLTPNNSETLSEDPVHPSDQHQQAHQHRGNRERRRSSSKPHPASPTAIKEDAEELSESTAATANPTSPAAATTDEGDGKNNTSDETQQPHQLSSSGRRDSKSSSSSPKQQQQQKLHQRPPSASRSRRQSTGTGDTTADVPAPGSHGNGGGVGGQESSSSTRPNSRRGSRQQHVTDDAGGNN